MGFYPNEGDVDANGAEEVNLRTAAGAELLGQQVSAASLPVVIASNQSPVPTTASAVGKTLQLKTGTLVTTTTTANQVILTYTVTAAKTLFMTYLAVNAYRTTMPGNVNPIFIGKVSLETPANTKLITWPMFHAPDNGGFVLPMDEDFWILAGTVVRVVVTPTAVTSTTWVANFGGYEI